MRALSLLSLSSFASLAALVTRFCLVPLVSFRFSLHSLLLLSFFSICFRCDCFTDFLAGDDPTLNSTPRSRGIDADLGSDFQHASTALEMVADPGERVRRDTENGPRELRDGAEADEDDQEELLL